jgi:hypothetical protein
MGELSERGCEAAANKEILSNYEVSDMGYISKPREFAKYLTAYPPFHRGFHH